jgi:hypothetical protein
MSTYVSEATMVRMRNAYNRIMIDKCQILTLADGASDAYGIPAKLWSQGAELSCGFRHLSARELLAASGVPNFTAQLRLPIGTVVSSKDRIKVTRLKGKVLSTPQEYEVFGEPMEGSIGILLNLRSVTTGATEVIE